MKTFLLMVSVIIMTTQISEAQTNEDLFLEAREKAFSEDYEGSINLLRTLQKSEPGNTDYGIFLARVYSWNKNYQAAFDILENLLQKGPLLKEALEVMTTTQLWAGNHSEALRYSNQGIEAFGDLNFKIQKARALFYLERSKEAQIILSEILETDPDNDTALELYTEIVQKKKHVISASYTNTSFSSPAISPWHSAWLFYKTDLGKLPVLVKYNFGSIYDRKGSQLEAEAYPKIGKSGYIQLNAGIGLNKQVFPEFKAGAEYYHTLNERFEISGGGRMLGFETRNVFLFTGQVSYNMGKNFNLTYRPYAALAEDSWSLTHSLSFALSNPLKENIWKLDLQYGSVPYEYITETAFSSLETFRIGLQHQWRVSGQVLLRPVLMYENEEYLPSEYRNRFNVQLITTVRF